MMQVEVPTTLTTSPSLAPAPMASQCASNAPTGIGIPGRSPSFSAQRGDNVPAILSEVAYSPSNFARTRASKGSTFTRKLSGGRPPSAGFHIHLCPIAHTLRFTRAGSVMPQSVAATMSQCSNALANCSRLPGL